MTFLSKLLEDTQQKAQEAQEYERKKLDVLNDKGNLLYTQYMQDYTPKTNEELAALAQAQYEPVYNANVEAANNALAQQQLNYDEATRQIGKNYDAQQNANTANVNRAQDTLTTSMLRRGMGRSSYAQALLYNNGLQGISNANNIEQARTDALASALATLNQAKLENTTTLGRLKGDYASNILALAQQLSDQEYQKQQAANQNNLSIVQWLLGDKANRNLYKASDSSIKKATKAKQTGTTTSSTTTNNTSSKVTLADTVKKLGLNTGVNYTV